MKAIRVHEFGGPGVMRVEEVPDPWPGPCQVLVRVWAIGVNPVETYIRAGWYPRLPDLPYTPGSDAAGEVVSVGEGVTGIVAGDRVYTAGTLTGSYAELTLCDVLQTHPLPSGTSYPQGAALGTPYAVAYHALFHRASLRPGETVLVHGATGEVGIAAVQLARNAGATVIGTGGSDEGLALVMQQGAHHVFDHREADQYDRIRNATEGRGVDVTVEMLANVNLGEDLKILARGGRVAVVGSRGTVTIDPRDAMMRDATILGVLLANASKRELGSIHAALRAGLENGTLRPVIRSEVPLERAAEAHVAVMESAALGKIVLIP